MSARGLREPLAARLALILAALAYVAIMLLLPLGAVLFEALRAGVRVWFDAVSAPDARASIWLTLVVAAISVPLNTIFGVAASWAIAKFDFRGKATLVALIELPFSVSPVVSGLDLERHGVGLAADVTGNDAHCPELPHRARVAQQHAVE